MRRGVLLAGMLLATSFGHAAAADLALSAPPPLVPPSWSGFYVGAHAGAAWQSLPNWSFADPNQFPATFASATLPAGNAGLAPVGGFQGGFNWQFAPTWVLGVEGDVSWTTLRDRRVINGLFGKNATFCTACAVQMGANTDWLASARGKLGYVAWNTLFYATAGAAWSNVEYSATGTFNQFAINTSTTSFASVKSGWVAGGGAEWMLASSLLVRIEYLYYGFPSTTGSAPLCAGTVCGAALSTLTALPYQYNWASYNVQVARLAVSYKF
jgi:outer membrane immunogenic protein